MRMRKKTNGTKNSPRDSGSQSNSYTERSREHNDKRGGSLVMDDEEYTPAVRPPNAPGGNRVRFEREGDHEQSIWGGGAQDIEQSILRSTQRNIAIIGWTIVSVEDVVGDLGSGSLQSITFKLKN